MSPLISQMLTFLAKIFQASLQKFHSNVLMGGGYDKSFY